MGDADPLTKPLAQARPPVDEGWDIYAERRHARYMLFIQFQKDYGTNVIRSLFLLNGGSAVATLTLIGALFTKDGTKSEIVAAALFHGARPALVSFSAGLVATVLAATMGYLNFNALSNEGGSAEELLRIRRSGKPDEMTRWRKFTIKATFYTAPICCAVAGFTFIRGGMFMSHAMKVASAAIIH